MLQPIAYSLNTNNNIPIYDINQIIENEGNKIEEWLNKKDIIVIDIKKIKEEDENKELNVLNELLETIDKLEQGLKED